MAIAFDRLALIPHLKDAPWISPGAAERVADALAEQLAKAGTIDRRDLTQAVTEPKVWSAGIGGVVLAALSAITLIG
jgi:hypothetical protein